MKYAKKPNQLYPFLLAVTRATNRIQVIALKNKSFDSLYNALTLLKDDLHFSHIKVILSDKESGFVSGKISISFVIFFIFL